MRKDITNQSYQRKIIRLLREGQISFLALLILSCVLINFRQVSLKPYCSVPLLGLQTVVEKRNGSINQTSLLALQIGLEVDGGSAGSPPGPCSSGGSVPVHGSITTGWCYR
jgi:hypothetical protein